MGERDHNEAGLSAAAMKPQIAGKGLPEKATALLAAGALVASGCTVFSHDKTETPSTLPLEFTKMIDEDPVVTTTSTTTTTAAENRVAVAAENRAHISELLTVDDESGFDCTVDVDDTVVIGELDDGSEIVLPRLGTTLPVDSEARTQDNRLFSDSMANPLDNVGDDTTKQDTLREVQSSLCEMPELAATAAHYFANMEVDGIKVVDLNPWLEEYVGDAELINDKALELVPQYLEPLTTTAEEAQEANTTHRVLAEKLATLLARFENTGVKDNITTTLNYHAVAGNLQAGSLTEIELNPEQYTGRFLELVLTEKDGSCARVLIVNTEDQRFAETDICDVPEAPITETPEEPPTTPPTTPPKIVPPKVDDGILPGNPAVPADQDPGTPDVAGEGDAGQPVNEDGTVGDEVLPEPQVETTTTTIAPEEEEEEETTTTTTTLPPADEGETPSTTLPPVDPGGGGTPEEPITNPIPAQP